MRNSQNQRIAQYSCKIATQELATTNPNLFIVAGDQTLDISDSQPVNIKSNVDQPRFQERAMFWFSAQNQRPLELHYIDNRVATTISPGLNTTQLRPQTDQIQFFNSPPFPRSGFYETPLLDQLKYGDWDAPE